MDVASLRAVMAVVRAGSLTAASRELGIPRATLRRRIEELEAEVGAALFERSASGARATPAGERLIAGGAGLVDAADQLLSAARSASRADRRQVRVCAPTGPPPHHAAFFWEPVRAALDGATLFVTHLDDPFGALQDDPHLDAVVHVGERPDEARFRVARLGPQVARLFASESYLEQRGAPTSLETLREHALYLWQEPSSDAYSLPLRDGSRTPVRPQIVSGDAEFIRSVGAHHPGICYAPLLPTGLPKGQQLVLEDVVGRVSSVWLVARRGEIGPSLEALFERGLAISQKAREEDVWRVQADGPSGAKEQS